MEAVPKLPMLHFDLKVTTEATSFVNLKRYIAECYQEDPDTYSKEVYALESLRSAASRPSTDVDGCNILKRYYCQLHSIESRFPLISARQLFSFSWRDVYASGVTQTNDFRYDMAVTLYNYGVLHTQLGALESRTDPDSIKRACTHFQCAAWAFGHLRETFPQTTSGDLAPELLVFMQELCFAQAQECILEKSLADNRKAGIVAKVTAQIVTYYNAAFAALLTGGEEGAVADIIGSKYFKEWKRYVKFKISYLSCVLLLYQGQQSEEQQKMGERVTFYQAAFDKLEEARKECKGMADIDRIDDALTFVMDVVEGKRKAAKNENEFIYHEEVPDINSFSAIQGASLVKGIAFSITDPEFANEDIFHRLVPMIAHEASSMYSEEKATILRNIGTKIEDKDNELNQFMGSLNVESLSFDNQSTKLPQGLVDRCAAINAKPNAIPDLVASMSNLADTCTDVESMLQEIKEMLLDEERNEKSYQQTMGSRPSGHFAELNREFVKYQEAHNKAGESNDTLRKAMGLHVNNLKALAQPLSDVQNAVPVSREVVDQDCVSELNALLAKVNEMRMQRSVLHTSLREEINKDDITAQLISCADNKFEKLFKKELSKHLKTVTLIEHNLTAQGNILRAMTDCYARCAPYIKSMVDTKHKREHFFSSLAASYDVYDDLLSKSAKGLEFYKKLQGNIHKLLARVRGARDVQDEERQQRLKSTSKPVAVPPPAQPSSGPKLKDFLKNNTIASEAGTYVPLIRPSPLGSETTVAATCVTSTNNDKYYPAGTYSQQQPNEPPPPYAPYNPHQAAYSQTYAEQQPGYANALFQQQQQSQQPPPYNLHAEPTPSYATATSNSSHYLPDQQQPNHQTSYTPNVYSVSIATPNANPMFDPAAAFSSYTNVNAQNEMLSSSTNYQFNQSYPSQPQQPQPLPSPQLTYPYQQPQNYYQPSVSPAPSQTSDVSSTQQWSQSTAANLQQQMQNLSIQTYDHSAVPNNSAAVSQHYTPEHNVSATGDHTYAYTSAPQPPQSASTVDAYGQYVQPSTAATYTTTSQPNYQITANNQYVTGYDQSGSMINDNQFSSYSSHPGYSFNQQTGEYQYASGYQNDSNGAARQNYSQYTNVAFNQASNTTESTNLGMTGQSFVNQYSDPATVYNDPGGVTAAAAAPATTTNPTTDNSNYQKYQQQQQQQLHSTQYNQLLEQQQQQQYNQYYPTQQYSELSTYDPQSQQYISQQYPTQQQPGYQQPQQPEYPNQQPQQQQQQQTQIPPKSDQPATVAKKSSNIDLLSGLDFTPTNLTAPPLQPKSLIADVPPKESPKSTTIIEPIKSAEPVKSTIDDSVVDIRFSNAEPTIKASPISSIFDRKSSTDNLSICSDLSSLDQNFDWESASQKNDQHDNHSSFVMASNRSNENDENVLAKYPKDPFDNAETLKWFHKEVERYEKMMDSLNIKTLNGSTPLDSKWKELQDLLVKDESKRSTAVAKLFPEKNRTTDSIPYDHARVMLPTSTDNYINAVHVRELGAGCPQFILAQTPLTNTVKDFWHMIWSQKSRIVVCLHSPTEMLDPFFPQQLNREQSYGDFSVTVLRQFDLSHCLERSVKVTMHGSDVILDISIVQIKAWPKNSPPNILGAAQNIIATIKQQKQTFPQIGPVILNCVSGSERSGLLSLTIATILATFSRRPILINAVDVWYRICSQRKGALRDISTLALSMQIVLNHSHDLLNKRGIMTSYQMKNAQTTGQSEIEETKDPFSDLDPLWKLKQAK